MESSANRRILALWLPLLPIDRIVRRRKARKEAPSDLPLVVAAKIDNALRLTAVDRTAMRLRLSIGMALADARARIPALDVTEADENADAALLESVAGWCDRFTPFVALDAPHGLFLDVTGCAHLFGGERELCAAIRGALNKQGFTVRLAVAGTSAAARALARYADKTIVPPGQEAGAVAPLPAEALNLDPLATHALKRAGLKTVGAVARASVASSPPALASPWSRCWTARSARRRSRSRRAACCPITWPSTASPSRW